MATTEMTDDMVVQGARAAVRGRASTLGHGAAPDQGFGRSCG